MTLPETLLTKVQILLTLEIVPTLRPLTAHPDRESRTGFTTKTEADRRMNRDRYRGHSVGWMMVIESRGETGGARSPTRTRRAQKLLRQRAPEITIPSQRP